MNRRQALLACLVLLAPVLAAAAESAPPEKNPAAPDEAAEAASPIDPALAAAMENLKRFHISAKFPAGWASNGVGGARSPEPKDFGDILLSANRNGYASPDPKVWWDKAAAINFSRGYKIRKKQTLTQRGLPALLVEFDYEDMRRLRRGLKLVVCDGKDFVYSAEFLAPVRTFEKHRDEAEASLKTLTWKRPKR